MASSDDYDAWEQGLVVEDVPHMQEDYGEYRHA